MKRGANSACWPTGFVHINTGDGWFYPVRTMMRSKVKVTVPRTNYIGYDGYRTICPDWIPPQAASGRGHEVSGSLKAPADLVPFPASLLEEFARAFARSPNDEWILRQYARMLIENGDIARADALTRACASRLVWCGLLMAYVAALDGRATDAVREFAHAYARMPTEERCVWDAIPGLSAVLEHSQDQHAWCAQNAASSRAIWWLATPFYSDSVDWRRLEHLSRRVRIVLANDLPMDAYHDLRAAKGGDVVVEMRLRYGWPTHVFWPGRDVERAQLMVRGADSWAPPDVAPEYSMDRVATLPKLRVGLTPFTVEDSDYELTAPKTSSPYLWWPMEHFRHPGGTIETVAHQQRGLLRRDSTAILIVASDLRGGRLDSIGNASVHASLVFSPAPDSVAVLSRTVANRGAVVVLQGEVASPGIAGFENLVGSHGLAGVRTRFGIDTLPTLSMLEHEACAISLPMLVTPNTVAGSGDAAATSRLLGRLVLDGPSKLGLFWEAYGFSESDTAQVSIVIASVGEMSRLRRLGVALRLADDPTTAISMRWREPRGADAREFLATRIPVSKRELAIDISQLRAGEYVVAISMERSGCLAVRSERAFSITR